MLMMMLVTSDPFTSPPPHLHAPLLATCWSPLQMVRTQRQVGCLVLKGVLHLCNWPRASTVLRGTVSEYTQWECFSIGLVKDRTKVHSPSSCP